MSEGVLYNTNKISSILAHHNIILVIYSKELSKMCVYAQIDLAS